MIVTISLIYTLFCLTAEGPTPVGPSAGARNRPAPGAATARDGGRAAPGRCSTTRE